jgi:hypothetical protein
VTEASLTNYLQSLPNIGTLKVTRVGDCAGYSWGIKWNDGGAKPQINIDSNSLTGVNASISISRITRGGVSFIPIPDNMLRTYHTVPQVTVNINSISSKCTGDCSFEWLVASTPVVTNIDTSQKNAIVLTGMGFDTAKENNNVFLGPVECIITSATATQLICSAGLNPVGVYEFVVYVKDKGIAKINSTVISLNFTLSVSSMTPTISGTGGGVLIEIMGSGFSNSTQALIDNLPCSIVSYNYSLILCRTPANPTISNKSVDVVVSENNENVTLPVKLFYNFNNTQYA